MFKSKATKYYIWGMFCEGVATNQITEREKFKHSQSCCKASSSRVSGVPFRIFFVFPTMLSTKFQLTKLKFKFIVQFIRFLPNASNNLSSPLLCRESRCELQILANDKLAQCSTVSQSVLHFPIM